jgi:hypothetical protein
VTNAFIYIYLLNLPQEHPLAVTLAMSQTQAVSDLVKDVDVVVSTAKSLLARAKGKDGHVSQRVDALSLGGGNGSVDDDAVDAVLGIDKVLAANGSGGQARAVLVDLVVLTVVRGSTDTTGNGVARLPVGREVDASAIADLAVLLGVLGETRLFVDANGIALGALVLLGGQVFGIGRAKDAVRFKSVSGQSNDIARETGERIKMKVTYSKPWPWSADTTISVSS